MVLRPDERAHRRMQRLMNVAGSGVDSWWGENLTVKTVFVGSDPGDQSVWRSFYGRVHELPIRYNTFKKTRFYNVSAWADVALLHDPDVHRKRRIPLPPAEHVYQNLTKRAYLLVNALATSAGVQDRG